MKFYKFLLLMSVATISFSIYSGPKKGCFQGTDRSYHPQTQVGIRQKKRDDLRRQMFKGGRSAVICAVLGAGECAVGGGLMGYRYVTTGEIDPYGAFGVGSGITTLGFSFLKFGNAGLLMLKLRGIPNDEDLIAKYEVRQPQRMLTRSKQPRPHIGPPSAEEEEEGKNKSRELQQVVVELPEE